MDCSRRPLLLRLPSLRPPRTCGSLEPDLHAGQLRYPSHVLPWVRLDDIQLAVLQQQQGRPGVGW